MRTAEQMAGLDLDEEESQLVAKISIVQDIKSGRIHWSSNLSGMDAIALLEIIKYLILKNDFG